MSPEEIMQVAIAEARQSKTPFGAVIAKEGEIMAQAGNTVQPDSDPTAHAEVNAIRQLTQKLGNASFEPGYTLYTTCEPCPMCAATCIWAGLSEIVYGAGADDFPDGNPNLIDLRCQTVIDRTPSEIKIRGGVLKAECKQLHADYPLEDL